MIRPSSWRTNRPAISIPKQPPPSPTFSIASLRNAKRSSLSPTTTNSRAAFTRIASKSGEWFPLRLTILRDFENQSVNLVHKDKGAWPARNDGILIEQSGATLLDTVEHERVRVRTGAGEAIEIPMSGFLHDTAVAPRTPNRKIFCFVTPAPPSPPGPKGATRHAPPK